MIAGLQNFYRMRPLVSLCLLGAFSALGFAPVFFFPATILGFSGLFVVLSQPEYTYKKAFLETWAFFLGYFVVGLYWIALSLHVDWVKFGWLFPFAAVGLPAFLALFNATGAVVFRALTQGSRDFATFLICALCFSAVEYTRGHIWTGFPWQLTSDIWFFCDTIPQLFAFCGTYGVSLLTTILLMLPGYLYLRCGLFKGSVKSFGIISLVLLSGHYYGKFQLSQTPVVFHNHFEVMVVQPNIPQKLKWKPELFEEHIHHLMRLSQAGQSARRKIIIWPEAASPFAIDGPGNLPNHLAKILKPLDVLLIGAPRYSYDGGHKRLHNSMVGIGFNGEILTQYDKVHLVPFGEYVPARKYLPDDIAKVSAGATDFTPGKNHRTLEIQDVPPFSPLICYEIIFPSELIDESQRPEWLLNLTNDAWYLDSSGPYQHFQMTRARAIEEGLPVVRSANTGISAVIDGKGRVLAKLDFGKEGVVTSSLPKAEPPTFYAQYRDWIYFFMLSMFSALALIFRVIKRVYPCPPLQKTS